MSKTNLSSLSKSQIFELFSGLGGPAYRGEQLFKWIWQKGVSDFDQMSNISKDSRSKLSDLSYVSFPKLNTEEKSADGTVKYLFELEDGTNVETVWIPRADKNRATACISTQVGCRMGCTFCMTAQQKLQRNLSAGEIAGQISVLPKRDDLTNIVVMGMGEPFDNFQPLMDALEIITDPNGLAVGPSKITVSTSGLVPAIEKFLINSKCRLAVSLNAPNDVIRSMIMPINKAYPIKSIIDVVKKYTGRNSELSHRRRNVVTFEYILIKDINDRESHAKELVQLLKKVPCKVNLLLYNENPFSPFKRPEIADADRFQAILRENGILNFLRSSRGRDISAACGQLASKEVDANKIEEELA